MRNWKKYFLWVSLLLVAFFLLKWGYNEATGDFNLSNISHDFPFEESWELPKTTPEQKALLKEILNQPYAWLGQGHQIYAFVSADQKYVLKIFKFKRLKSSWTSQYLAKLPFGGKYFRHQENKRLRRLAKLFQGYKLAYVADKENTGILFLHLDNRTTDLDQQVKVTDKLGFEHNLNLDGLVFAIQERGIKTKDVLKDLLSKGNVSQANQHINRLLDMYVNEYKKGIIDQDHNVLVNTGFVGGRPVRLDVGQLKYDEAMMTPANYQLDLKKVADKRLSHWLKEHYPQYFEEMHKSLEQKFQEIES